MWPRVVATTFRQSGVGSSSEGEVSKNSPQLRVRASHPGRAKPSATFQCSYLPNACLWCVFVTYFFTPFFSQLLILYSHVSTNRMDGGGGGGGGGGCTGVAQDSDKWQALLHTAVNCRNPQSAGRSRTSWDPISFSRKTSMELVSWLVCLSVSQSSLGAECSFIVKSYKEPKWRMPKTRRRGTVLCLKLRTVAYPYIFHKS
jgi:hypothetical protein